MLFRIFSRKLIIPVAKLILFSSLFAAAFLLFTTGCSKEATSGREIITVKLNNEIRADSLEAYVKWLEGMGTRFCLADNSKEIAEKIKNKFQSFGYNNARLDSFRISGNFRETYPYDKMQYNVSASIQGTFYPDSLCIIGGHYDNILRSTEGDPFQVSYGANDNASGVAALLEIARVMKENNYSPGNSIIFVAFGAEETGLWGSHAWAGNAGQNNHKIKMMLNNDMIAYQPGSSATDWIINIIDYNNSYSLRSKAQTLTDKYTDLGYVNDNTYYRQSDSYPFYLNGYKALFFIGHANDPNYHTLNDRSSECNFEFCREVAKISCSLLVDANTR